MLVYGRGVAAADPAGAGRAHLRAMLDALATAAPSRPKRTTRAAAAALMTAQKRRALIVWLTDVGGDRGACPK